MTPRFTIQSHDILIVLALFQLGCFFLFMVMMWLSNRHKETPPRTTGKRGSGRADSKYRFSRRPGSENIMSPSESSKNMSTPSESGKPLADIFEGALREGREKIWPDAESGKKLPPDWMVTEGLVDCCKNCGNSEDTGFIVLRCALNGHKLNIPHYSWCSDWTEKKSNADTPKEGGLPKWLKEFRDASIASMWAAVEADYPELIPPLDMVKPEPNADGAAGEPETPKYEGICDNCRYGESYHASFDILCTLGNGRNDPRYHCNHFKERTGERVYVKKTASALGAPWWGVSVSDLYERRNKALHDEIVCDAMRGIPEQPCKECMFWHPELVPNCGLNYGRESYHNCKCFMQRRKIKEPEAKKPEEWHEKVSPCFDCENRLGSVMMHNTCKVGYHQTDRKMTCMRYVPRKQPEGDNGGTETRKRAGCS